MSTSVFVTNAVAALLLPPLDLALICVAGLLLRRRWPRLGLGLGIGALLLLAIISTPVGALLFVAPLENLSAPLLSPRNAGARAVVVLGGGRLADAPEYGGHDVPAYVTLARLRYAAHLHRVTGLPLLAAGGRPDGVGEPEAETMARSLREDFGTPVEWVDDDSDNTAQNAQFSARILKRAGIDKILLVTDAMHMPRARAIFEKSGLRVVPAPTIFFSRERLTALDFLPSGEGLRRSHYALHEWLGLLWYRLRYGYAA